MKKILFIDRDGTLIDEPIVGEQVDSFEKLKFIPNVISALKRIVTLTDYRLVIVTNQDGLGTDAFPMADFIAPHKLMLNVFEGEGIVFDAVLIDDSFPNDMSPRRKPEVEMVEKYMNDTLDYENSYVIGDRASDIKFAQNMGVKSIFFVPNGDVGCLEKESSKYGALQADYCSNNWAEIATLLIEGSRNVRVSRKSSETEIDVELNLNSGCGGAISTGLGFFDHMLEQISRHADIGLNIRAIGDLKVDEHHTIEDVGLVLGDAFKRALVCKNGVNRYGFSLPMDDASASVLLDFGGRSYLKWEVEFKHRYVGDFPTDMAKHFWTSFTQTAGCNLNISASGEDDHHKIEAIFKAVARAIKQAVEVTGTALPSSKGIL